VTVQMEAVENGAPACMLFQSVAGTEKANSAFGVTAKLLDEAYDLITKQGVAPGPNLMYFETGQGAEMSLDCHCGVDGMTLEARTYGFAKRYAPFMVNNVSGFIGPETLYDGKQIIRASLEDLFMGKLTGLPMGMAPCYTNHTNINQDDQEVATMLLAMAGSNYYMGVGRRRRDALLPGHQLSRRRDPARDTGVEARARVLPQDRRVRHPGRVREADRAGGRRLAVPVTAGVGKKYAQFLRDGRPEECRPSDHHKSQNAIWMSA